MESNQDSLQLKERIQDLQKFANLRAELKPENLEALTNYEDIYLDKRIANLNKVTKFVNRLKICEENSRPSLLKDLKTFNLSSYQEEVANSIAICPMNISDLPFFLEICSQIHREYEEFGSMLGKALVKNILNASGIQDQEKQIQRRIVLLRLLGEVYLCGIPVTQEKVLQGMGLAGINQEKSKDYIEKNISSIQGKKSTKLYKNQMCNLQIKLNKEFVRNFQRQFFGRQSRILLNACQQQNLELPPAQIALQMEYVQKSQMWIKQIYLSQLQDILDKKFEKLLEIERKIQKNQRNLIAVKQEDKNLQKEYSQEYKYFYDQVMIIINELSFEEDQIKFQDAYQLAKSELDLQEQLKKQKLQELLQDENDVQYDYIFKDEKNQKIYEQLIDLKKTSVPHILLQPTEEDAEAEQQDFVYEENHDEEVENNEDQTQKNDNQNIEFILTKYSQCLKRLQQVDNTKKADDLAIEFCYINTVQNRRKLIYDVINKYDWNQDIMKFIPYRVRLVVTISQYFPNMIVDAQNMLQKTYLQYRDETSYKNENYKNLMIMSEFVKFGKIQPGILLNWVKIYIDQLNDVKLDYVISVFQNCGIYLTQLKDSKSRFQMILSFLQKKKDEFPDIFTKIRKEKLKNILSSIKTYGKQ
ncbi:Armadillo-type fold [Pseudocohnilembus persalinus]|uniref:Armadillo-type fold n=1 Tax=Pseudocohnilembus persalinus TaxID=266149 RepID=A0A0V0QAQ3_PSEPJ|nr:Armadillo-type fold [Pseudocohnilembus persalinus]|eukprot:KRW99215.1 Armadillo-type fold [Pseudocohnilembus persalinus]